MPRGNYEPEIRSGLQSGRPARQAAVPPMRTKRPPPDNDSPAEIKQDTARGITQGSAADTRMDAMQAKAGMANPQMRTSNLPPDAHHVAAATSIAHAILGRRPGGM